MKKLLRELHEAIIARDEKARARLAEKAREAGYDQLADYFAGLTAHQSLCACCGHEHDQHDEFGACSECDCPGWTEC